MIGWFRKPRVLLATALVTALIAAVFVVVKVNDRISRTEVVGYFDNPVATPTMSVPAAEAPAPTGTK